MNSKPPLINTSGYYEHTCDFFTRLKILAGVLKITVFQNTRLHFQAEFLESRDFHLAGDLVKNVRVFWVSGDLRLHRLLGVWV